MKSVNIRWALQLSWLAGFSVSVLGLGLGSGSIVRP